MQANVEQQVLCVTGGSVGRRKGLEEVEQGLYLNSIFALARPRTIFPRITEIHDKFTMDIYGFTDLESKKLAEEFIFPQLPPVRISIMTPLGVVRIRGTKLRFNIL